MAFWRGTVEFTIAGSSRPAVNIWDLSAPDGTFPTTVAENLWNAHGQSILAALSASVTQVKATAQEAVSKSYGEFTGSVAGSQGAAMTPANTAYLVHKIPASGPRRTYGRAFIPGPVETDVDAAGNLTQTRIDVMNTETEDFHDLIKAFGAGWDLGMIRFTTGGVFDSFRPLASLSCDPVVATQRRRMRS